MPQSTTSSTVILSIAIGGAVGSVARYLLTMAVQDRTTAAFPFGTLVVNVAGCLVLGFLVQFLADRGGFSVATQALLTTGLCGGFTTFSTFSWETIRLIQAGALPRAALYVCASLLFGLTALWVGMGAAKMTDK